MAKLPPNPMMVPQRPYRDLSKGEIDLLLGLCKTAFEEGQSDVGFVVGGELHQYRTDRDVEDAIDDLIAERTRRTPTTAA